MQKWLLLLCLSMFNSLFAQQYQRVKINLEERNISQLAELGIALDHGTHKSGQFFISDFSTDEVAKIQMSGFQVEVLIEDVSKFYVDQNKASLSVEKNVACPSAFGAQPFSPAIPTHFNHGTYAGYLTYQEMLNELDEMANLYPNLISSRAPIGTFLSIEGRPIYYVKISNQPLVDEAETEILYTAVHHAREPGSMITTIFYMWYLLENYATNPEIKYLVDHNEMYFVPCVNPDGYLYNESTNPNGGGMHRKNRRNVGTTNKGVDLNRNYSYQWNTTGVSSDLNSDVYPGTSAFSEPESQAIKWFCEQRDFLFAFNAHTYSNDILFPIGATTTEFAADHNYFQAFTNEMVTYNQYTAMKSSLLYPASGDSDDYMYKMDPLVKPQIFAMTPEIGSEAEGFWPPESSIDGMCQDMTYPNLMLAYLCHQFVKVKDVNPTRIAALNGNLNVEVNRLGQEGGNVTVSLIPLQNVQSMGNPLIYNLNLMEMQAGSFSYSLNPGIQFDDTIKYVIKTDYTDWVHYDTIIKLFGGITLQVLEDGSSLSNWNGNWGLSATTFVSPSNSYTDTPVGNYSNNSTKTITYNSTVNLTNVSEAMVSFYAKWDIEADYDYTQFQVSTDNGLSWIGQCGLYTNLGINANGSVQPLNQPIYDGQQLNWVLEEINLSEYIGQNIKMRFIMKSDGGSVGDGFYFDDFKISYNANTAELGELAPIQMNVFPNPTKSSLSIHLGEYAEGAISVINQQGDVVKELKMDYAFKDTILDVNSLPNGVYFIHFKGNQTVIPVKFIVLR